ncbi:MAG: tyrosine-type recombinase/integrase [Planctomycetaceae bacterium]
MILRFVDFAKTYFVADDGTQGREVVHFQLVLRLLRERFGRLPIAQVTGLHIEELQEAMIERDWSRGYANSQLQKIRRFFRWAVRKELCPVDVLAKVLTVDGLRSGRTRARETDPVEPVSETALLATLPQLPQTVRDLVKVIRLTGARPSEIRLLKVCDIDRTGETWQARLRRHKNSRRKKAKARVIFFGPKAQSILKEYLDTASPNDFIFSPRRSRERQYLEMRESRKTKVQPSQRCRRSSTPNCQPGEFYSANALNRCIKRACEIAFSMPAELRRINPEVAGSDQQQLRKRAADWRKANCWTPYQLRHSAATEIRKHFGIESAGAVLGHARLETTEIYAEKNLLKHQEVMREVG